MPQPNTTLRFCHRSVACRSVALYGHSETLSYGLLIGKEQGLGFKKRKKQESIRSRTSQIKTDSYYRNARLPSENRELDKQQPRAI
jgi:hypothetical protein